jgi:hypothetical protein
MGFRLCAVLAFVSAPSSHASDNGLLYVCDTSKLSSENLCYFAASSTNTAGASPHSFDRDVAADGRRQVVDVTGSPLEVAPRPWTQGDALGAATADLSADLIAYSQAFELVAPLRDVMMYAPAVVSSNATEWARLTKAFVDCHIKAHDETFAKPDGSEGTAYSVDKVYELLKDPDGQDIHHSVLQFLEEGAIDLVCLMTSLSMDRCDQIRATNNVVSTSACWEESYVSMYGDYDYNATSAAGSDEAGADGGAGDSASSGALMLQPALALLAVLASAS